MATFPHGSCPGAAPSHPSACRLNNPLPPFALPQDPRYMATFPMESSEVIVLDIR